MKAITVRQPWAWAIIFAGKDIENRSWYTRYRGPVAIHAGMGYKTDCFCPEVSARPEREDLEFGAILGVVELVEVVEKSRSRWFEGPYGFVLSDPSPLRSLCHARAGSASGIFTSNQQRLVAAQLR